MGTDAELEWEDTAEEGGWVPGAMVADHRLLDVLGSGAFGTVWRAVHVPTGSKRAIKALASDASLEERARFAREIEALAQLDGHPHVVRVHAAGLQGARPYLILDLARGDLAGRLEAGPLPNADAGRILVELATGLAHVHRHGLLHRDLKPQNVLFAEGGRAMLADFGLVRGPSRSSLTQSGTLLGTPSYMAPEQVRGDPVDARTDVYGLGAILYHMLTGRPPHSGTTVAVLHSILGKPPPSVGELNPHVDPTLAAVCARAMAPLPGARYASADELAAALRAEPDPGSRDVRIAGVAAVLLALAGVVGVWAVIPRRHDLAPPEANTTQAAGEGEVVDPAVFRQVALASLEERLRRAEEPPSFEPGDAVREGLGLLDAGKPEQALSRFLLEGQRGDPHGWFLLAEHLSALPDVEFEDAVREACLRRGSSVGSLRCSLSLADLLHEREGASPADRQGDTAAMLYRLVLQQEAPAGTTEREQQAWAAHAKLRLVELCAAQPQGFPLPLDEVLVYAQELYADPSTERGTRDALEADWLRLGEHCLELLQASLPAPKPASELGVFESKALGHGIGARVVSDGIAEDRGDYLQAAGWAFKATRSTPPDPQAWVNVINWVRDPEGRAALQVSAPRAWVLERILLERARAGNGFRGYESLGHCYEYGADELLIRQDSQEALRLFRLAMTRAAESDKRGAIHHALARLAAFPYKGVRVISVEEGRVHLQDALDAGRVIDPAEEVKLRAALGQDER